MNGQQMADAIYGLCPKMVEEFSFSGFGELVLRERPINVQGVCTCVREEFLADKRLLEKLTPEKDVLSVYMEGTHLRSYTELRFFQSVLTCVAMDLELSLLATAPEK